MSGSNLGTNLDRSSIPAPDTRADAIAYLTRTGNADLLDVLGLVEAPTRGRPDCPMCGRPRPVAKHGGHKPCQRRACLATEEPT